MKYFLFSSIVLCLLSLHKLDIPVHCTKSQIVGEWEFKATMPKPKNIKSLYEMKCGHSNPSHESSALKFNMDLDLFTEKFTVMINSDGKAIINRNESKKTGIWTMVYDEGFDFSFGKPDDTDYSTYFVFSKYKKNDNLNPDVQSNWVSFCYATLIGWYQVGSQYGCFYGVKVGKCADEVTNGEANNKQVVVEGSMKRKSFLELKQKPDEEYRFMESKFSSKLRLHAKFKDHAKVVERINSSHGSWKAAVYSEFEGKSIEELNKIAGRKKSRNGVMANFHLENEEISENTLHTYESVFDKLSDGKNNLITDKPSSALPLVFNYTNLMGTSKSQGGCGSCYTVSTVSMLEARFKKKYEKKLKTYYSNLNDFKISVSHVLKCSVYNQGCDGGYSYLVSKFFNQFEIYPEKCFNQKLNSCYQECADENLKNLKLLVKRFYYVGGAYGKTNEQNLMEDLYKNGPIVVSFEPDYSFMSYKSGVYDFDKDTWWSKNLSKPEWQKVDHSVLLVGWGIENINGKNIKYWLLQNSWGNSWGENGYVKFRRGIDLLGIESIGEAAIPYLK